MLDAITTDERQPLPPAAALRYLSSSTDWPI
jgi:hypothetical protein